MPHAWRGRGNATLIGLIVLPAAWGYEQRQRARAWQSLAGSYRVRELTRRAPMMANLEGGDQPCRTLERLGLDRDARDISAG